MNKGLRLVFLLAVSLTPARAYGQWEIMSNQRELRGKLVVDVGTVTNEARRSTSPEPLGVSTRKYWREFEGRETLCFDDPLGYGSLDQHAAVILVDAADSVANRMRLRYLATFTTNGVSVSVRVEPVISIRCPKGAD